MEIRVRSEKLEEKLKQLQELIGNLRPVMRNVAILMREEIEKNFKYEGRDEHGNVRTWQPLSEKTQKRRAKYKGEAYAAHPILEFTGRLKQSINIDHGKDYAKVYTGVKYGVYHQTGTRKIPARPFMIIPRPGLKKIKDYLQDVIRRVMRE